MGRGGLICLQRGRLITIIIMDSKVKTKQAAEQIGTSYSVAWGLIRDGLVHPERDCSGDYWWSSEDLAIARRVLAARRRRRRLPVSA